MWELRDGIDDSCEIGGFVSGAADWFWRIGRRRIGSGEEVVVVAVRMREMRVDKKSEKKDGEGLIRCAGHVRSVVGVC